MSRVFIVGEMKCGTTTLWHYLKQNPKFRAPLNDQKELYFFDPTYPATTKSNGFPWYKSQFPKLEKGEVTGEATTSYFASPFALKSIKKMYPEAKIIILLRNPIDRAYSHYQHVARKGGEHKETLSFEEALKQEPLRLLEEKEARDNGEVSINWSHRAYFDRGRYIKRLPQWIGNFSGVTVLTSDFLFENHQKAMEIVESVTGLPHIEYKEEKRNIASYPPMNPSTREKLRHDYEKDNQKLFALLGRDLNWE